MQAVYEPTRVPWHMKLICYSFTAPACSDLIGLAKDEGASDEERLCKCQFFHKV